MNPPTIRYPDRTAIAPQMSLLSLCALLFRQSHLFLFRVVLTRNDSRIIPRKTCQIPRNCPCKWLLVSSSAPGTSFGSSGSPGKFCYTRVWIVCTALPNLVPPRHIVPRFTFFTWNFVIRWNQVPEMFRSGHDWGRDIAIWVLRKVRFYTVLTQTRFHFCSRLHWKSMRWLGISLTSLLWVSPRLCWSTFINQILSEFLLPIRQFMRYISLYFFAFLIYIFVFGFCGFMQRVSPKLFTRTSTSFLFWIFGVSVDIKYGILWWRWWRSRCSWGRTRWWTRNHKWFKVGYITKFNALAISDEMWFLTAGPVVCVPMVLTQLPQGKNCGNFFKKNNFDKQVQLFDIYCRFLSCLHLAVDRHHRRRTSWCPHGLQLSRVKVFLTGHMHSRSWINCKLLFFRLFCWRSWEYPFLRGKVECSLVLFFEPVYVLGKIPCLASGTSLLSFSLFLRSILQFHSVGTSLMRNFDIYFSQWWSFFFQDTRLTLRRLRESYPLNWFRDFLHRWETSASETCDTQPYCDTLFTTSHTILVIAFSSFLEVALFRLLIWLFINFVMRKQTLVSSLTTRFFFYRNGTRADANIHKTFACRCLSSNICTVVEEWTHGYLCFGYFSSSTHFGLVIRLAQKAWRQ